MDYDWDWVGAEQEYQRAILLNPGYVMAHAEYGWYLVRIGRTDEATAAMQRALELEPRTVVVGAYMAWVLFLSHRYDEAYQEAQRTLDLEPTDSMSLEILCECYVNKRDFPAARATAERIQRVDGAVATLHIGVIDALAGKRAEALESLDAFDRFSKQRYIRADFRSYVYASLGEAEEALDWLEKAVEERSPGLLFVKAHPLFDCLHSNPRFARLLKKMRFPS